jgi:hypothetical protein
VHCRHVGDAGGNAGALALKLVDEAGEIIQPGAFRTPIDDAQDGVSGGKVRPDVDAGRRFDLAFNGARSVTRRALTTASVLVACSRELIGSQPTEATSSRPMSALETRLCLDQNWDACCVRVANWDLPPAGNLAAFASNSCLRRSRRLSGSLVWAMSIGASGGSGICLGSTSDAAPGKPFLTADSL